MEGYIDDEYGDEVDDWVYAEDGYHLADDLAAGVHPDAVFDEDLWDQYYLDGICGDFWDELEYDQDDFYDMLPTVDITAEGNTIIEDKRKRTIDDDRNSTAKRRKSSVLGTWKSVGVDARQSNVVWTTAEMVSGAQSMPYKPSRTRALLPDWRVKFKDNHGWHGPYSSSSQDLHDLATSTDELDSQKVMSALANPEVQALLQERLASIGLPEDQQGQLLEQLMQMLSEGNTSDLGEMLEHMTSSVLEEAFSNDTSASAAFLTHNGIKFTDGESQNPDDAERQLDHESSVREKSPGDSAVSVEGQRDDSGVMSPSTDSVLKDVVSTSKLDEHKEIVRQKENESPTTTASKVTNSSKKRKGAPDSETPAPVAPKRQQRGFAAPTASSQKKTEGKTLRSTRSTRYMKK